MYWCVWYFCWRSVTNNMKNNVVLLLSLWLHIDTRWWNLINVDVVYKHPKNVAYEKFEVQRARLLKHILNWLNLTNIPMFPPQIWNFTWIPKQRKQQQLNRHDNERKQAAQSKNWLLARVWYYIYDRNSEKPSLLAKALRWQMHWGASESSTSLESSNLSGSLCTEKRSELAVYIAMLAYNYDCSLSLSLSRERLQCSNRLDLGESVTATLHLSLIHWLMHYNYLWNINIVKLWCSRQFHKVNERDILYILYIRQKLILCMPFIIWMKVKR